MKHRQKEKLVSPFVFFARAHDLSRLFYAYYTLSKKVSHEFVKRYVGYFFKNSGNRFNDVIKYDATRV